MNILFLCHRFPYPPHAGSKVRAFHMIRHLALRHRVTVCSIVRTDAEAMAGEGLADYCDSYRMVRVYEPLQVLRMMARLPTAEPSSMGYFYDRAFEKEVRSLLVQNRFDLIVVHCSSVAPYVEHVSDVPKLLDFCDMDSQKWLEYGHYKRFPLSLGYRLEGIKLERAEARLARSFDVNTVATIGELATLEQIAPAADGDWFPNGVDAEYFAPSADLYDANTISFIGRMDYYPNEECMVDFCARTLPLIRERRQGIKLVIVGAEPSPKVRRLGEIPGVIVTGSVPDVRPYVWRSAATVAPLNIARGTQNKILEAMAMGVPVVSSGIAARGVDAVPGAHLLVADTPADFATAVLDILANPTKRQQLAAMGRARMKSHHAWDSAMKRLDGIIERCLASPRVGAVSQYAPVK